MKRAISRKALSVLMVVSVIASVVGFSVASPPTPVMAVGSQVIYNLYATDGYHVMADGTRVYGYGYVGGRRGVSLTYLASNGSLNTLAGGSPDPTPGPPAGNEILLAGNASFPAPVIYATTSDVVEIRLKNLGTTLATAPNDPHTVHLHGIDSDAANDGVPETSVATIPANDPTLPGRGNVVVYMFSGQTAGTYMYHCHQEADIHVTMGMYGALVIYNPADAAAATGPGVGQGGTLHGFTYSKDYIMMLTDTDVGQHLSEQGAPADPGFNYPGGVYNPVTYTPQYWFINGLSFPNTVHAALPGTGFNYANWIQAHPGYDPLIVGYAGAGGQKVLVRVINLGFQEQPMHVHGFHPKIIGADQRPWPWANTPSTPSGQGLEKNTFLVGSGETYEVLMDFATQRVSGNYPGPGGRGSAYDPGTESRYNSVTGLPVSNNLTANPVIPDLGGTPYIGGPVVTGLQGAADTVQYFPWHNHDDYKATNNGVYPGGMFTLVKTAQAPPPSLSVATTSLPAGTVGVAYTRTLAATAGTAPYTWSVTSGAPPTGLSVNATTGVISGTPTVIGTSNFTVQVRDSAAPQATASQALSITINPSYANMRIGWNTLATPVKLDDSIDTWGEMATVAGLNFRAAYSWNGTSFVWAGATQPVTPLNSICVEMEAEGTVTFIPFNGTSSLPSRNLTAGWNLVGSGFMTETMPVNSALVSAYFGQGGLWGYSQVVSPGINTNGWTYVRDGAAPIPDMLRGKSYWVFMTNPGTLAGFTSTP